MELTAVYSFEDTMKKLMLTDEEHNEVIDLFEQELARQAEEDVKIARSQALQLEMLLSGATATSRESFSASLGEGLYTDLDNSPMFIVKKSDIAHAQRFLRSVKLKEYVNRLWRYEGVALPPIVWNVSGSKNNEPSNAIEWSLLEDEQQDFQALENAQIGFKLGEKRKGKALLRKVDKLLSGAKPVKRRRIDSGPVSSKLPSGLRNSISGDNLEETVATGPPALQATLSPHRQPAPPSRRQPPKEKKSGVQHVRFIRKSSEKPQTLQTLPKQPYNPLEHTPDLAIARKHTHSWLADQGEPYTPLASASEKTPSPQSTPSHAPKARLTPSQARLAQIENILGKKTHAAINLVTPNKAYAVSIAPTTGAPPDILSEKTRSASRHADAELTPVSGRIESKTRDGTDLTHKLVREVCKEPTSAAQAQGDNVAIEPCQKKRKIQKQDDTTYRTSGQRRPKTQGQDESSYKAAGQKRRKIQVR
jgi:hypothetical protein